MDGMGVGVAPVRYSVETRWLHWSCAWLIGAQFVLGEAMHRVPRALHGPIVSVHLSLGVLLAALFVTRVAWRVTGGRAIRFAAGTGLAGRAAPLVHGGLYLMLGVEIALGYLARWSGGNPVEAFGAVIRSPFGPMSRETHHLFGSAHGWLAWAIIVLAGGHGAAALYHARVARDGVLRRMWA
ncbi:cytochrome B561 [Gluconacetobacter sacchari DSM 12717]|uniref:Cytochrome b n=2 Tax=Gluconacetobacter sacchari TaxID=92759 RepID=A0A7W4NK41_9PROT|nr:cytochrome b [Gluconacetobacter sacchari]MBB2159236.1 cytochrome b [Gluconacetobacter sacchari]GBQ23901.1 cytochrome B561 [Gluconacetobacter sacchari DSM 12717]